MKKIKIKHLLAVLLSALSLNAFFAFAADDYCYMNSSTRGAGTLPTDCGAKESEAGLCYTKCKDGYTGGVTSCYQNCPADYLDTGALCHINKPLLTSFNYTCTSESWGICWSWSATCPEGYVDGGLACGLKTPGVPAGYSGLTGLDLVKKSYDRGVGTIPGCQSGTQNDAGLCYPGCPAGSTGAGPVCWNKCPAGYTACGAGCATSTAFCATVTSNQVMSVATIALNIGTMGGAGATEEIVASAKAADEAAQAAKEADEAALVANDSAEAAAASEAAAAKSEAAAAKSAQLAEKVKNYTEMGK